MNVLTVNYNTQDLTDAMIMSLNRHTPGCKVYVFDNSDRERYRNTFGNVEVIDNTDGRIIDFEKWLDGFPDKYPKVGNRYGSARHCKSVDICFDLIGEPFLLADSDILIRKDVSTFFEDGNVATGEIIEDRHYISVPRLAPYLCYIDVSECLRRNVRYFNGRYMWKLNRILPERFYDTGAWFLLDLRKKDMAIRQLHIDEYMLHFRNGSWKNASYKEWLNENKELWQQDFLSALT